MKAIIINIGDELLIGQTINTNAAWMGQYLNSFGIEVESSHCISDKGPVIYSEIDNALKKAEVVVVTGGLGPTKDDITKHTLATYFNTELVIDPTVLGKIEEYFRLRGREMLEVNTMQAALPKSCTIIPNNHGTASGMWFEKNGSILISLPGVPYEMKGLMKDFLLEKIQNHFQTKALYHKTILTTGIGESFLAETMAEWESRIRALGLGLAYLPSPGLVKLRISSYRGKIDAPVIQGFFEEIEEKLPQHVFGYENDTLPEVIGKLLLQAGKNLGTVESCTGGGVANAIVSIPGSSAYFQGNLTTYSYELKTKLAGVKVETLAKFGAVSEETVAEMAIGGREKLGVDYCISISGVAGPDGGTPDKPVGTVWMAVALEGDCITKKINLGDNRERNIQMTIFASLNMLRNVLLTKRS